MRGRCGRSGGATSHIQDPDLSDRVLRKVPSTAVSGEFQAEHIYASVSAKTLQRYFGYSPFVERKKEKPHLLRLCNVSGGFSWHLVLFFAQSCCAIVFLSLLLTSWDAACDSSA